MPHVTPLTCSKLSGLTFLHSSLYTPDYFRPTAPIIVNADALL